MVLHIQKVKALCLGWYGKGNCGDESYKTSIVKLFPNLDIDFTEKIDKNKINEYDAIILGGGNILEKPFLDELKKAEGMDIYAFSVGISDNIKIEDINIIKHIYIRDINSKKYLEDIGYDRLTLCPDAAFCLEPEPSRGEELVKNFFKGRDLYENKVSIVINSYLIGNRSELSRDFTNFQKFAIDLSSIIDETNASFIFLPFSTNDPKDDRVSNGWVASKCKYWKKNKVIYDELNNKDILDIISYTNTSINTRLHASIFSLLSGKPFIDITHHDKNKGFLNTIGAKDFSIDYWHFEYFRMKELLDKILYNSIDTTYLSEKSREMSIRLKRCADDLCFNKRQ